MSELLEARGTVSPDGRWYWDGHAWRPRPRRWSRRTRLSVFVGLGAAGLVGLAVLVLSMFVLGDALGRVEKADSVHWGGGIQPPAGFPADFPVYPASHLSLAIGNGKSFDLQYLTSRPPGEVADHYRAELDRDDWRVSRTAMRAGAYVIDFERRSDARVRGSVKVGPANGNGVAKISVELESGRASP